MDAESPVDSKRLPDAQRELTPSKTRRLAAMVCLSLLAAIWSFLRFWTHPEAILDSRFLVHDLANQLHLSDELLAGKRLYSGVFSQYGPACAYLNALVASVFQNSARNFMLFQSGLAIVSLGQACLLLRRSLRPWLAVLFAAIALLPWIPSPAGGPGAYIQPYGGLERIVLLSIALMWRPLTERTALRNITFGLLLASLQWIKFGGAFIAGAALLFADLIALAQMRQLRREHWKRIVSANALILAGFLAGQAALVLYVVSTQPSSIARDVLWPSYMARNYAGYVRADIRFIHWQNFGYFVGAQLPIVAAVLSFAFVLVRALRSRSTARTNGTSPINARAFGAFAFLFLFWCIGLSGYLAHVWLMMGYAWLLMVAAGYALRCFRPITRLVALAAWVPCFLLTARGICPTAMPADLRPTVFQNGETLWLDPVWQPRLQTLFRLLTEHCGPPEHPDKAVMAFVTGGGVSHYLGYPGLTRHSWFMPGFVRPYDEQAIRDSLPRTGILLVFLNEPVDAGLPPNVNRWGFGNILSEELAAEIPKHFGDPVKVDSTCWFLPARDLPGQR